MLESFAFSRARSTYIFLELSFLAEAHELAGYDWLRLSVRSSQTWVFFAGIRRNNSQSLVIDVASAKFRYQKYQAPPV